MKILLVHSNYNFRGGEDAVFDQECELLRQHHAVETLIFKNQTGAIGALQFIFSIWNLYASYQLKQKIGAFKPDLIHIHNWHFGSGPIIIRTANKFSIPTIMTLHNYRMLCPSGLLLIDNKVFTDSLNSKFPWTAIRKKGYRNSYFQTFWLALIVWFHKKIGTWSKVSKYIALTEFSRSLFANNSLGIKIKNIEVKPNFREDCDIVRTRSDSFLFIGRLSSEKGVEVLLEAFCSSKLQLHIAGNGPLRNTVLEYASKNKNIQYLGDITPQDVLNNLAKCTALIVPSVCFEGLPMTIVEAYSTGTPIIASNLGNMASLIMNEFNGLLFEPGSSEDLNIKLHTWMQMSEASKRQISNNALDTFRTKFTKEANYQRLMEIYQNSIN